MTRNEISSGVLDVKALLEGEEDYLRAIFRAVLEEVLEAEMTATLGAKKGERTASRVGCRSGYYSRTLVTRVGTLELRVPQDRDGRFSTRKVKAITEEFCGVSFSASAIGAINKTLDDELQAFAERRLEEPQPRHARTLLAGWPSGRRSTPGFAIGSSKPSRRR